MTNRQQRSEHAHAHLKDIQKRFPAEIAHSIETSRIYGPQAPQVSRVYRQEHQVNLVALDSVSCLYQLHQERASGKVAVLNYASYKFPGGQFLGGSAAQEEALCHESILYPVLTAFDSTYYAANRGNLNRALYTDSALYSPDILFERDGKQIPADVITCAAPNFTTAHRYQHVSIEENDEVMRKRINFMYQVAEANKVDVLIAGAWGCGVFGQYASHVCRMLVEELQRGSYNIAKVYFAIPDATSANYKNFDNELRRISKTI